MTHRSSLSPKSADMTLNRTDDDNLIFKSLCTTQRRTIIEVTAPSTKSNPSALQGLSSGSSVGTSQCIPNDGSVSNSSW